MYSLTKKTIHKHRKTIENPEHEEVFRLGVHWVCE